MDRILEALKSENPILEVPLLIEQYSLVDNCFNNVIEKISKDGGSIVYGWKILKYPFSIEAERHAVWRSNNNELVDITPMPFDVKVIYFVEEDKGWIHTGDMVDNIRVNTTNNELVDDLFIVKSTLTKLFQTGRRKSATELLLHPEVVNTINDLENDIVVRYTYIFGNNSKNSRCYCSSGLLYKDCHGNQLEYQLQLMMEQINSIILRNSS